MRGTITATVNVGGESATTTQTRTQDGFAGITPTAVPAAAGELTTRTTATVGVITTATAPVATGEKAILTWTDAAGNLKHRYNVDCVVTDVTSSSGSSGADASYTIAVSGGTGDDLPAAAYDINVALQYDANVTFDFDDMDLFVVTTNVRGVVVFLDATDTEKCVVDMNTQGLAMWLKASGFPAPISGTPVTHALFGSGSTATTNFTPKVLGLYDATYATSGT